MSGEIQKVAQVAADVGFQAGIPQSDVAGLIVSFLAANPEHIERFMRDGAELFIDGTIKPECGCLSYLAGTGEILTPADLRARTGVTDQ